MSLGISAAGWAAIGAVGSTAVGAMNSGKGGGGGGGGSSQTASKDPWLPAQPWLMSNLTQGQNLQNQYAAQPFNAQQLAAYANMGKQNNYINAIVPDLLSQIQTQPLGYDRNNPTARPVAYQFTGAGQGNAQGRGGLLDMLTAEPAPSAAQNPAPAPAPVEKKSDFRQLGTDNDPSYSRFMDMADIYAAPIGQISTLPTDLANNAGYGSFVYGQDVKPGTQAYRDMQEYLSWGGRDPAGFYSNGSMGPTDAWQARNNQTRRNQSET